MRTYLRPLFAAVLILSAAPGCRPPLTVDQLVSDLQSPSAGKRRRAATDLQTPEGIPEEAIPALLAAARTETDPGALGVMLMTIGKSGVPEARPIIDQYLPTADRGLRTKVGRALQAWFVANGQMAPDAKLPKYWPYGQPGYPPPLSDQ